MVFEDLITEKNVIQIAILACFFFFGDWIHHLIIDNLKKTVRSQILGFIISLGIILVLSSIPILLVDLVFTNISSTYGWILSGVILIACFIRFYMS